MRVRRYRAGGAQAPVVALVDGDSLGTVDGSSVARDLGVPLLAVMLPPRRDDCALRLRGFTMARELPLSLEAAWAARAALDGDVVVELGVTGTRVGVRDGLFVADVPRPVLEGRPVDDPAAAARALGIDPSVLDPEAPVRTGSCGLGVLVVPVLGHAAGRAARLDATAWAAFVGKAKLVGALVASTATPRLDATFVPAPGAGDGWAPALAMVPWALARGPSGGDALHEDVSLRTLNGGAARFSLSRDGTGAWRAEASVVSVD